MNPQHAIIIQRMVDAYAKGIRWGCLMPIAIGFLILLVYVIVGRFTDTGDIGFVPELNLHYKIVHDYRDNEDGKRIYQARLYFSRTDTFATDYIEFDYTPVDYPNICYVEPDTIYVIDRYYSKPLIQNIINKEFNIVYLSHQRGFQPEIESYDDYIYRSEKFEREDSMLTEKSYSFALYNFVNDITVFDLQGKIIYEKSFGLF